MPQYNDVHQVKGLKPAEVRQALCDAGLSPVGDKNELLKVGSGKWEGGGRCNNISDNNPDLLETGRPLLQPGCGGRTRDWGWLRWGGEGGREGGV